MRFFYFISAAIFCVSLAANAHAGVTCDDGSTRNAASACPVLIATLNSPSNLVTVTDLSSGGPFTALEFQTTGSDQVMIDSIHVMSGANNIAISYGAGINRWGITFIFSNYNPVLIDAIQFHLSASPAVLKIYGINASGPVPAPGGFSVGN